MNDKTPLVSVIIPVYNAEKYLSAAILSILNQTYKNLEIILLDDGSTDSSFDIIEDFKNRDKRVIIFQNDHSGIPNVLNKGIELAQGKYIARMDADDISTPSRIEKQISKISENNNFVLCGTWFQEFGNSNKKHKVYCKDEDIRLRSLISPQFCHPAVLMRSDFAKKFKYDEQYDSAEDYMFYLPAMETGKVFNIPEILLKYRIHESQISTAKKDEQKKFHLKVAKKYWLSFAKINTTEEILEPIIFGTNDKESLKRSLLFIKSIKDKKIKNLALSHLWKMNKKQLFFFNIITFFIGGFEAFIEKLRLRS